MFLGEYLQAESCGTYLRHSGGLGIWVEIQQHLPREAEDLTSEEGDWSETGRLFRGVTTVPSDIWSLP
jgi:hypothetical protein